MDIRFEEAVAEARHLIADGLTTTGMDAARDRFLRQGASRRLRTDPDALIAGSTTDPAIFDHLRVAVADAIARREALRPEATRWLTRLLRHEVERPAMPRGAPDKPRLHRLIWTVVNHLVSTGRSDTPTHNEARGGTSACAAVAAAMMALRKDRQSPLWEHLKTAPLTYDSVRKIWLEQNRDTPAGQLAAAIKIWQGPPTDG